MSLFRDRSFNATALAHLVVDLLNSQLSMLLAVLSVPLRLSNSLIGLVSTIYTLSASLSQPAFGWLADRFGSRWVVAGGVFWIAGMFTLAVLTPGHVALIFLVLGALGSGAFHPAGTMEATLRGRQHFRGRETTAASLFFVFGQAGYMFGPAIGGPILDLWGPPGLLLLMIFVLPAGLNAGVNLKDTPLTSLPDTSAVASSSARSGGWLEFLPFLLLTAFRAWSQSNMVTFLPKYYTDMGYKAAVFGFISALFMGGSAVGGVGGGWLADRFGGRRLAFWTLLLASFPLGLFAALGPTPWVYLLSPVAGALTGATHSVVVVMGQHRMPRSVGAASGLVLGFTFASGALGTLVSGVIADASGFGTVFITSAVTSAAAALMAVLMREA